MADAFAQTPKPSDPADLQLYTNGRVLASIRQPDGSVIFAGSFSQVNGVKRPNIARLTPEGPLDPNWNPPIDGYFTIGALAADQAGHVYVGYVTGTIEKVSGTGTGSIDETWHPHVGVGNLRALAVDNAGNVYISGITNNQTFESSIAKVSSTGEPDPAFKPAITPGSVTTLALDAHDNLYIGGSFTQIGGVSLGHLARFPAGSGIPDPAFNPAPANGSIATRINAILPDASGNLFVGGTFATIGGQSRANLAKLSASSGDADPQWNAPSTGTVRSLALDGTGNLYVGGSFTSIAGLQANNVARLSASGAADVSWNGSTEDRSSNRVNTISLSGSGNVALGGFFSTVMGQTRHSLALVTAGGALLPATDAIRQGGLVSAIATQPNGGIIIGGYFSGAGNFLRDNVLRLQPDGSVDPNWSASTDAPLAIGVNAIAVDGNDAIYVGGEFTQVGGQPRIGIAKVSGGGVVDPRWGVATNAEGGFNGVESIAIAPDGRIYIGGDFLTVGKQPHAGLARFSALGDLDAVWNSPSTFSANVLATDGVRAIAVDSDGSVYAPFNGSGCGFCVRKYSPEGAGAVDPTWGSGAYNTPPSALLLDGIGHLYVGSNVPGLARLSTADGKPDPNWPLFKTSIVSFASDGNNYSDSPFRSLALGANGDLFVGGTFTVVGNRSRDHVLKISPAASVIDSGWNPQTDDGVYALAAGAQGQLYLGGSFTEIGTTTRNGFGVVPQADGEGRVPDNLNQFGWTGAWYDPRTGGQGIMLYTIPSSEPYPGTLFGGWFTFDIDAPGKPSWYTLQGPIDATSKFAGLTIYANNPAPVYVGNANLRFSDCQHATLEYQIYTPIYGYQIGSFKAGGTIDLQRLSSNVLCTPNGDTGPVNDYAYSGAWYDGSRPFSGLLFDVDAAQNVFFAAWYITNYGYGSPGLTTNNWYTLQSSFKAGQTTMHGVPIIGTAGGLFDTPGAVARSQVGTADLVFNNCNSVTMSYSITSGADAGNSGLLNLSRGAGKPASCAF